MVMGPTCGMVLADLAAEVVMGGLAYMTGPEGRPLRAGTSVDDIMDGMFGAPGYDDRTIRALEGAVVIRTTRQKDQPCGT